MNENPVGKIGTVDVRLVPYDPERQRYERKYVPVTPASREIVGSDDKVAPDSTVAEWHIDDWSAGEGDLRWQDRGRYRASNRVAPTSDGSGIVTVPMQEQLNDTGGATVMTDARALAYAGGALMTADDMSGNLFKFNDSTGEWDDTSWGIGGAAADNVDGIASVDGLSVFVSGPTTLGYGLREVNVITSSEHYDTFSLTPFPIVTFRGLLYGVTGGNVYLIDQSSVDTREAKSAVVGGGYRRTQMLQELTTSDVGPVWLAGFNDGRTEIWEYNVADDTSYVVGELPRDTTAYSVAFHSGIYFVAFRYAPDDTVAGDAWLYYQNGGQRGVAGPIPQTSGSSAGLPLDIAGVVGDRLYIYYDTKLWAYDLSTGGISVSAGMSEPTGLVTYGQDIHYATGTTAYKIDPDTFDTSVQNVLYTGRYDFGYLGLNKALTRVTVTCEEALAASETVGLEYSVDGGAYTALTGTISATETTKTWVVSSKTTTARGIDFEFKIVLKANTTASSPKVVSMTAEAVGSESRLEWVLLADASDTNEQHAIDLIAGLKALKTAHDVVEFTDPWQVLPAQTPETFDVTVEEVNLPDIMPGGDPYAVVRLRAVATV